ncbi:histone-lysine N-methyltransferase family member SUVH2-like [Abrus precatorius]|uniref:Histone-lysine N-methyltransferase family member SUVH2-like n=1 Tax=Abrus precatorius TaxID=3816 RepID=A0A8B8MJF2_ABRPR|nr:histone-lysine N-methyltransferase family member SUVH2-like [Abrus precatorius]
MVGSKLAYYGSLTGCDCVDGCGDGCFCAIKNGGDFPYSLQGLLLKGKPLISECGPSCPCPLHCRNRLTQRGLKNRFEVFRSQLNSWGVRSLDLIQAGSFICEYTGVVLNQMQEQILIMNSDQVIYPNRFSESWAGWGDLSPIYPDYVRPSYPPVPLLDVSIMKNLLALSA